MVDPAIQQFFEAQKEKWLKDKIKSTASESSISELKDKCNNIFRLEEWLPAAAKRAKQVKLSTHPCTFSHPSARKNKNGYVQTVIADRKCTPDGYIRTGNVKTKIDAFGNAAAMDVIRFVSLKMQDGNTLLEHIKDETPLAKGLLNIKTEKYTTIRDGFLAITAPEVDIVTSSKLKQVHFPVKDGYHLLSILTNSGMVFELKERINRQRFSERQKELRAARRNNKYTPQGYSEIYDLTTIGYGGTKPQNISILNSQYGGKAFLLLSAPPHLEKRKIRFPKHCFFQNSITYFDIKEPLKKIHGIFKSGKLCHIPVQNLRTGRDKHINLIINVIIERMHAIRSCSTQQFKKETSELPLYQKVWLTVEYLDVRENEDEWLGELCKAITKWITDCYKKFIKKSEILGPAEREYVHSMVLEYKEHLR